VPKTTGVLVAMSGGVDSSVAAGLLVEQGYRVVGVTLKLWNYPASRNGGASPKGCCSLEDIYNARDVCTQLGIPHYTLDFTELFQKTVIRDFISEYFSGRTPNPCINCNTYVKWQALYAKLGELKLDYLATGHYARRAWDEQNQVWLVARGRDQIKDQSYVLAGLTPQQIEHTLFPLGEYTKSEIREWARERGLLTATKAESQEICFIPDNDYRGFLEQHKPSSIGTAPKGKFVDTTGKVLGFHNGVHQFTIGQRKGLGLSAGRKLYVKEILPSENVVVLGTREEIRASEFLVDQVNFCLPWEQWPAESITVQIRYHHRAAPATVVPGPDPNKVQVTFRTPQEAITPGQRAVFYHQDRVLGGGRILKVSYPE